MAAEYLANAIQSVNLNSALIFTASIPCRRGYVYHEDETGIFILHGPSCNTCNRFATYQVTVNGNIAVPTGGTAGPIAIAITTNGEIRPTSRAIVTPAAVDEYQNVTATAIIQVPRGCCFNVAVESVAATSDPTATPAPVINAQNMNLVINRIA